MPRAALVLAFAPAATLVLAVSAALGSVSAAEWAAMPERAKAGGVVQLGDRAVEAGTIPFQPTAPVTIRGGVFMGQLTVSGWRNHL